MAHTCPDCGVICHCGGDIDDLVFGESTICYHCDDWGDEDDIDQCDGCDLCQDMIKEEEEDDYGECPDDEEE